MLGIALACCHAGAHPAWDGNRLLWACTGPTAGQRTGDCDVFIRGAVDRYHERLATRCAPRQVRFGEIVEIVVRHLRAHPAARQRPANDLILASLPDAYCGPARPAPRRRPSTGGADTAVRTDRNQRQGHVQLDALFSKKIGRKPVQYVSCRPPRQPGGQNDRSLDGLRARSVEPAVGRGRRGRGPRRAGPNEARIFRAEAASRR